MTAVCYAVVSTTLFLTQYCRLELSPSTEWVFSTQPLAQIMNSIRNTLIIFVPVGILGLYVRIVILMQIVPIFCKLIIVLKLIPELDTKRGKSNLNALKA